jgi:hypothetical protein
VISRGALAALAAGAALFVDVSPSRACSCAPPRPTVVSPVLDARGVAPNARVLAFVPDAADEVALRRQGGARVVGVKTDRRKQGDQELVELTPANPLDANTAYEIFVPQPPGTVPQAIVIGAFTTGDAKDTTPPALVKVTNPRVHWTPRAQSSMCGTSEVNVAFDVEAVDPGAPGGHAPLVALWAEKNGVVTVDRLPDAVSATSSIDLGRTSICDPGSFPFPPAGGSFTFAFAAVDVAGNRSAPRRMTVTLPRRTP